MILHVIEGTVTSSLGAQNEEPCDIYCVFWICNSASSHPYDVDRETEVGGFRKIQAFVCFPGSQGTGLSSLIHPKFCFMVWVMTAYFGKQVFPSPAERITWLLRVLWVPLLEGERFWEGELSTRSESLYNCTNVSLFLAHRSETLGHISDFRHTLLRRMESRQTWTTVPARWLPASFLPGSNIAILVPCCTMPVIPAERLGLSA